MAVRLVVPVALGHDGAAEADELVTASAVSPRAVGGGPAARPPPPPAHRRAPGGAAVAD
ncbi:hypothetical protein [Frankia sp. AgB32]|uniref:hypothetical protein n=1 Tax=Frankia sp. AgB32 TaxID=631119 RepID=UPI0020102537|nr:hypothetical protein [Frankia sp. AgB32]MCK9896230.1 hypothetical protein [Frankia sp. AgB32]